MLSQFVTEHRAEIIARCRARVAERMAPRPSEPKLQRGIPLFLDQLAAMLRSRRPDGAAGSIGAAMHGGELLAAGFTVSQVVRDYGDVCQTITEMAIERHVPITTAEFKALNACLDDAIADSVTEFSRQREASLLAGGKARAAEDLGRFAHELRNLLATATLAYEAVRTGGVGVSGSTGAMLGRSLTSLRHLVHRSLAVVRLDVGVDIPERVVVAKLIEEIEVGSLLEARARGLQLTIEAPDRTAVVVADRQTLASVLANLVQNAMKYTRPGSHVTLRSSATGDRVRIEVEDECGGLPPGKIDTLFTPFEQRGTDRSGLGLGLAICARGTQAIGGTISVRDIPGTGCVFAVELRREPPGP